MYEISYKNAKIKKVHMALRIKFKLKSGKLGHEHEE